MPLQKKSKTNSEDTWKDLFRSDRGEKYSATQFWFNVANLCVTVMYVLLGVAVYKSATPNIMDFGIFTAIYAGIVTGNKVASRFLMYRYSGAGEDREDDREDRRDSRKRRASRDEDFDKNLMEIHKRKVVNRDDVCL